ncbi:hypothetical protein [Mucisphaera sp.]|uniref:hypothetical protein n=1 Tax=Mucisphaera sp. TaxID=2913024 RepID=UPI003D0F3900
MLTTHRKYMLTTAALLAVSLAASSDAQVVEWNGGAGTSLWTDAANWDSGSVPISGASGDTVRFGGLAPGVVDLDGGTFVHLVTEFDGGATNAGYTLTNGTLQARSIRGLDVPVGPSVITLQTGLEGIAAIPIPGFEAVLEFTGYGTGSEYVVDGVNGGVIQDANGGINATRLVVAPGVGDKTVLRLQGANTHTGGTDINGGALVIFDNDDAFGSGRISTPGNAGRIAPIGDRTIANEFQIAANAGTDLRIASAGGGNLTHTGDIAITANDRNISVESGATYTWSGDFVDVVPVPQFNFQGDGTLVFQGSRTTGLSLVGLRNAVVEFDDDNFLGTNAKIRFDGSVNTTIRPIGPRTLSNEVQLFPAGDGSATLDGELTVTGTFGTFAPAVAGGVPTLEVINGGSLTIAGTVITQDLDSGRFRVEGDGTGSVTLAAAQSHAGAQYQIGQGGNIRIAAAGVFTGGSVRGMSRDGKLSPVGSATLGVDEGVFFSALPNEVDGGLGISGAEGTLTVNADVEAGFEAVFASPGGDGVIKLHDSALVTFTGAFDVADDLELLSDGTSGQIVLEGAAQVDNQVTVGTGVTLQVNGSLSDLNSIDNDELSIELLGTLGGTGTINAPVASFGGTVTPGTSVGALTINGELSLDTASSLIIEIAGTSVSDHDVLSLGNDPLVAAGTFQIELIDGFTPSLDDSFDVLDFGSASGQFDTLDLPALPTDLQWDTSLLISDGIVSIGSGGGILGDFNGDGEIDAQDIDLLVAAILGASSDPQFDLDGENAVDANDFTVMIDTVIGTLPGDANLDKTVNLIDLSALATSFDSTAGWADGNFNIDTQVNLIDLSLLATNFGQEAAVPEPGAVTLLALTGLALRRRQGSQ